MGLQYSHHDAVRYPALSPQNTILLDYMYKNGGRITARGAYDDLQMTSATLASRMCEMLSKGIDIERTQKVHPVTRKKYTEYVLTDVKTKRRK